VVSNHSARKGEEEGKGSEGSKGEREKQQQGNEQEKAMYRDRRVVMMIVYTDSGYSVEICDKSW
jgi:hypothetical protein